MSTQLVDQLKSKDLAQRFSVEQRFSSSTRASKWSITLTLQISLALGTPWLYQHNICVCFNLSSIEIGSDTALPMVGNNVSQIWSQAMIVSEDAVEQVHAELQEYVAPICKTASETPLPPLWAINHTIPLIDEHKKRRDYLSSGKQKHLLWTVVDLHACNANTRKVSAPLPSIEGILHHVAKCKYCSIIDGKDAYEQI
ncbi:hypothetical protein ARMSODRAFT_1017810 [Armillaria solidipes]|uniref:Uncharacterized protein n=1 Tax=Armillaria solidipes TaxID=1076256 RepID=A0A2H3C4I8_9AGAR|nr:hypothetical protein ARMSODRAFT_1017810 [Armillaria solidipes]